jgi:hypothetical protein
LEPPWYLYDLQLPVVHLEVCWCRHPPNAWKMRQILGCAKIWWLRFAKIVQRGELWRDGNFASFTVFLDVVSRYFVALKSFSSGFVRRKNLDESVG